MASPPSNGGGGRGQVNLLRDLENIMEVRPDQVAVDAGAPGAVVVGLAAASQGSSNQGQGHQGHHKRNRKDRRQQHQQDGGGRGPRPTLKDPELYAALMEECVREESTPTSREYVPPPLVTNYLVRNDVRPLKKRSAKFPKAQYYCRLCDYHCDTLTICISHIKDERHGRLARMQEIETTLYHLPKPSRQHLDYLEHLLIRVRQEQGLSAQDLRDREAAAARVSTLLSPAIPGSSVRLYGSSMTGFGLKDSVLNLDLQIPEDSPPHLALMAANDFVASSPHFSDVKRDFSAKIPMVTFTLLPAEGVGGAGLPCELSLSNHMAYQTSALLRDYYSLDPRVPVLAVAIRHWARLCKVDRQAEGTLPPHAFAILLVYFLQQETKPVLPCLHDFLPSRNAESYTRPDDALSRWKTRNSMTAAELLVEFFEFYSLGFRAADYVVSIRNVGGFTKTDKQWKGKKLAIEDPFSPKRNLTRSVSGLSTLDYISDCFAIAYLYFGTIQTTVGPVVTKILVPDASPERRGSNSRQQDKQGEKAKDVADMLQQLKVGPPSGEKGANGAVGGGGGAKPKLPTDKVMTLEELERSFGASASSEAASSPMAAEKVEDDEEEDEAESGTETLESFLSKYGRELTPKQARRVTELVPKNMISFCFDGDILTAGQSPVQVCTVCSAEGHLQNSCPEEQMPPVRPLPVPIQPRYLEQLESVCLDVKRRFEPGAGELRDRDQFLRDLTLFIQRTQPSARLTVFGSSQNGFAFAHSDLDISMTFANRRAEEFSAATEGGPAEAIEIIERLAEKLKRMQGVRNVQAITSAKVPIIKFTTVQYQPRIEGDISLYNVLAQENTKMLRCYSNIDERVKILGYMVKLLAKSCEIGDASRGSLSSYAYILMLLHFLQQRKPPVVPVLQELHQPGKRPTNMVDGWDAWFFSEVGRLQQAWPGLGRNRESVTELWLAFLQYYAHDFDDKNLVVCTRQLAPLTKFEKMWNSPCVAIEDPFELCHNLGAGISRKMNVYIKKCFLRTRDRFGFPPHSTLGYSSLGEYLWDSNFLCDGPPPNDRGCRACGKIGHLVRDCPKRKAHDAEATKKQRERNREHHRQIAQEVAQHKRQQQQQQQQQDVGGPPRGIIQLPQKVTQQMHQQQAMAAAVAHAAAAAASQQQRPMVPMPTADRPDALLSMLAAAAGQQPSQQMRSPQPFTQQVPAGAGASVPPPPALPASAINLADLERTFVESGSSPAADNNSNKQQPQRGFPPSTSAAPQQQQQQQSPPHQQQQTRSSPPGFAQPLPPVQGMPPSAVPTAGLAFPQRPPHVFPPQQQVLGGGLPQQQQQPPGQMLPPAPFGLNQGLGPLGQLFPPMLPGAPFFPGAPALAQQQQLQQQQLQQQQQGRPLQLNELPGINLLSLNQPMVGMPPASGQQQQPPPPISAVAPNPTQQQQPGQQQSQQHSPKYEMDHSLLQRHWEP